MKIVFGSNYYNHHQKPFCEALNSMISNEFRFVSTREMSESRKSLGYGLDDYPEFVELAYISDNSKKKCVELIDQADVVISGSMPEEYLHNRKKENKIIFRYSERLYKNRFEFYKWPVRALRNWRRYSLSGRQYLLCASAYTAGDFAVTGNFINKAYKWGYFPETERYENIEALAKNKNKTSILWCGRFLDWKHPDDAIAVAKRLKDEGYDFTMEFIGMGEIEETMMQMISDCHLDDCVRLLGSMSPNQVRECMEHVGIFLFTSDRREGWGAVLNESMNSGCAVVASHAAGSVPFLVNDGENGLIYESGNVEMLYEKVKYLLDNPDEQTKMGKAAYKTIVNEWNAEVAAERFLRLAREIDDHGYCDLYQTGPCSRADIIKNDWFGG